MTLHSWLDDRIQFLSYSSSFLPSSSIQPPCLPSFLPATHLFFVCLLTQLPVHPAAMEIVRVSAVLKNLLHFSISLYRISFCVLVATLMRQLGFAVFNVRCHQLCTGATYLFSLFFCFLLCRCSGGASYIKKLQFRNYHNGKLFSGGVPLPLDQPSGEWDGPHNHPSRKWGEGWYWFYTLHCSPNICGFFLLQSSFPCHGFHHHRLRAWLLLRKEKVWFVGENSVIVKGFRV